MGTAFADPQRTGTGAFQKHLHVCLSDAHGHTVGGHVMSLRVFTTAEIVLGECEQLAFSRPFDPQTGYGELEVAARHEQPG